MALDSFARFIAMLVGALFLGFPVFYLAALPPDDEVTWAMAVVLAIVACGGAMLLIGGWKWHGGMARNLRLIGFSLSVIGGLATVSYAALLVPVALLSVVSLRYMQPDEAGSKV